MIFTHAGLSMLVNCN